MNDNELSVCVNCSYSVPSADCQSNDSLIDRVIVYEIPFENLQDQQRQLSLEAPVSVKTVLRKIFNLNYLCQQQQQQCDGDLEELILLGDKDVGLCQNCANVLIILFENYNKFNFLGQQSSHLSKAITRLDEHIHRLQASHLEFQSQLKSQDCQQNNSEECIKDEYISQPEDEDYDFNDVAGMLDCDLGENVDMDIDNNSSANSMLNKLKTAKQNSVPLPKRGCRRRPIVKLDRVTRSDIKVTKACRSSIRIRSTTSTRNEIRLKNKIPVPIDQTSSSDDDKEIFSDDKDTDFNAVLSNEEIESDDVQVYPQLAVSETRGRRPKKRTTRTPKTSPPSDDDDTENWKCILCSESFEKSTDLSKHLLVHVPDDSCKTCTVCSINFVNRWSLLDHLRGKHCGVGKLPCPVCPKSYNTKRKRSKHLPCHWSTGQFICRSCLEIFSSKPLLVDHESKCDSKCSTRNACPAASCPKTYFGSEALLDEHVKIVHAGQKVFSCLDVLCGKHFALKRHLDRHVKFNHTDKKMIECSRGCGKKFESEKKLTVHQQNCEGVQVYECQVCSKRCNSVSSFNWHMKSHVGERRTYRCDHPGCDKSYYRTSHLKQHQLVHCVEKPFVCEKCGKSFVSERYLKDHSVIHDSAEKKNLCSHCGKSFLRVSGLTKHLRTHSDERQYKCTVCEKTFKYSESLRLHFLLQHKEAQFVCSVCGAGFPYRFNLQKHMRTLHPEQQQQQELDDNQE